MARSDSGISAIFASTSASASALLLAAFSSWARSFIAARSSAVKPHDFLLLVVADRFVLLSADFRSAIEIHHTSSLEAGRAELEKAPPCITAAPSRTRRADGASARAHL